MGQPCQVWILERLAAYLGTLEPCVDTHRTVSYIAWSYRGQERSGGTEALQMFFISGPQGKSVTATPGSFCSELPGRAEPSADAPPQSGYLTRRAPDAPLARTASRRHLYENFRSNLPRESHTVDVWRVSMYSLKSLLLSQMQAVLMKSGSCTENISGIYHKNNNTSPSPAACPKIIKSKDPS